MRKIKILGLFVVFVLPLLIFSTIRSEGAAPILHVVIIQCAGSPLAVTQIDPFGTTYDFCGGTNSVCNKGAACSECLAACIEETDAVSSDEVAGVAVSGSSVKTTVTYTLFEDDS